MRVSFVQGKPSPLLSSFRLSYYTLLNLMKRVEGGTHDLEYVIANSFQQFQQEQAMPKVCCRLGLLLLLQYRQMCCGCTEVASMCDPCYLQWV